MNIAKKDYPFWILIGIAVIFVIVLVSNRNEEGQINENEMEESPPPTPTLQVDVIPPDFLSPEASNYDALVVEFEGRRLVLDANCTSASPSNITFKNLTQIMIDNRASNEPRTVRIGDRVYNLVAHGWYLTTLYSTQLPANMSFFCGDLELGQIGLE